MGLARTHADLRFQFYNFWRMYDLLQLYDINIYTIRRESTREEHAELFSR